MSPRWRRAIAFLSSRSLSARIGAGIAAGAAVGLFAGEHAAPLKIVSDAYIKLLQMTVLPYVTVSIIGGLGSLDPAHARALGARVGLVLALLWALALAAVVVVPLTFPPSRNASFFSTTLLEEREAFDFLNLYIPTNPFHALANNVVPAVVLFSVIVGVALIGIGGKDPLLAVLGVARQAVTKATNFIVSLTPFGVFAIAAVVAGSLDVDELRRLEVYLVSYAAMSLLFALWILPGLIAALTPIPYRAVVGRTRDALLMAFMTTSLFAVLPLITEEAKSLVRDYTAGREGVEGSADVIVPVSFNFPHAGKLLTLSFVPFAAWFADAQLPLDQYPRMVGAGLFGMFGSANAAIPFLLDLLRIPADTFRLFVASGIVNARFGTLVAAVHTLTMAVLGTCAVAGIVVVDVRKLVRYAAVTTILAAAVLGGTRVVLHAGNSRRYDKDQLLTSMRMLRNRGSAQVSGEDAPPLPAVATSVLDRVRGSGVLRVGFFDDSLPYAFFNARHELVGFDVEMALQLARDLAVRAEFVSIDRDMLESGIGAESCDVVMSGVAVTAHRSLRVQFSSSYLDETVAFVVLDRRVAEFSDWTSVRALRPLRLGVPLAPYYRQKIRDELADVEIVPIDRLDSMFAPGAPAVDALLTTAERGSAYTLLHPEYSVAVPKPRPLRIPLAYVVAGRDTAMTSVVNTWIELKRKDGTIDELFAHWILGQDSGPKQRRWSIGHDMLRWW